MYLAKKQHRLNKAVTYSLRESVRDESGNLTFRELFNLGSNPTEYVEYIDERIFYISPEIEERLASLKVEYEYEELEEIFWPFIDDDIRRLIENFGGIRGRGARAQRHAISPDDFCLTHPFDRRRLYYLKSLQIDMGNAIERPLPIYEVLVGKCRDEIENCIAFMEAGLRPWDMRGYLYAIFDIASSFAPRLSRFIPDAQDQRQMDNYFLEKICRLNNDPGWLGHGNVDSGGGPLHFYLQKYLFLYFDVYYSNRIQEGQKARDLGAGGKWEPGISRVDLEAMGLSAERFREMSRHDLASHFRKKAMEMHPDKGGDHETFVALIKAYEALVAYKNAEAL